MPVARDLTRLWRHRLFRRLVAIRLATQSADGTLQVGMAAYVFFSPQKQPDAWSIALVLAVTLLPFSIVGPFVSLTLDRFSRRQVAVVTDAVRVVLAALLAWLVLDPAMGSSWKIVVFYASVLVAMSLNRYLLAGLQAGLPHTVDEDEYLVASSVMPMIGPTGVLVGAALAGAVRFAAVGRLETYQADAIVFALAAAGFALAMSLSLTIGRWELGPDPEGNPGRTPARAVLRGLAKGVAHLRERTPAAQGLVVMTGARILACMTQVAAMLLFRNHFHPVSDVNAAMADLGVWAGATGAGYVASAAIVTPIARRIGMRWTIVGLLAGSGVAQIVPGSLFTTWGLIASGFLLGLGAQALKICVDTVVQAHIDDAYKGRVFTLYDMLFNAAFVLAAVIVALVFPHDAYTVVGFVAVGVAFLALAGWFTWASGRVGSAAFDRGTQG